MKPASTSVTVDSAEVSQVAAPVRPESTVLRRLPVPLIFLIVIGLSVTLIYHAAGPIPLLKQWNRISPFVNPSGEPVDLDKEDGRLAQVLKASAMKDNTVILTTLNAAWASTGTIIDLFLESFHIGNDTLSLLDHLVIIAFDEKAYLRCRTIHSHCFALTTAGVDFSVQENFMSDGYLKMMWRRIDFLRAVLEMGYNFIFTIQSKTKDPFGTAARELRGQSPRIYAVWCGVLIAAEANFAESGRKAGRGSHPASRGLEERSSIILFLAFEAPPCSIILSASCDPPSLMPIATPTPRSQYLCRPSSRMRAARIFFLL